MIHRDHLVQSWIGLWIQILSLEFVVHTIVDQIHPLDHIGFIDRMLLVEISQGGPTVFTG